MADETPDKENSVETTSPQADVTRPARPRLVRSRRDRKIAGVAAGLAEHLNIDPLLVRIAFVVSVFMGGLGVLLYVAGWILIPEEGDQEPRVSVFARVRSAPLLAVVLFVIGGTLLLSQVSAWDEGQIFWGLVLIGIGWLLFRDEPVLGPRAGGDAGGPPPASRVESPSLAAVRPAQPAPVKRERPRSALGRYTFAVMLIVVGGVALLDYAGAFTLEVGQYPALALVVVGAGLLAGTFWGRSRALIVLGLLIVPFAWAGALVDVPLEGGFGERIYSPASVEDLQEDYQLVGGVMQFDLTDFEWGTEPVEIDATVAFGVIEVLVPKKGVEVELRGSVGLGRIEFFDEDREGYDLTLDRTRGDSDATRKLIIDARSSFGALDISDSIFEFRR